MPFRVRPIIWKSKLARSGRRNRGWDFAGSETAGKERYKWSHRVKEMKTKKCSTCHGLGGYPICPECRNSPAKEPRKIGWLARLVRGLVAREEKRLNLPKHWAGTSSETAAFMLRVGPWMIDRKGLHREYRAVSKDGKITNRRWKTIYPTNDEVARTEGGKRS